MDTMTLFLEYAGEFEKSYEDDDWSRLHEYLQPDASYEIVSSRYGCKLVGPEAIFKGVKKSLDGFDRRFDSRRIEVKDDMQKTDDEFSISWIAHYEKEGLEPLQLHGHSKVVYQDGKIKALTDSFTPEEEGDVQTWIDTSGFDVDLSYV